MKILIEKKRVEEMIYIVRREKLQPFLARSSVYPAFFTFPHLSPEFCAHVSKMLLPCLSLTKFEFPLVQLQDKLRKRLGNDSQKAMWICKYEMKNPFKESPLMQ